MTDTTNNVKKFPIKKEVLPESCNNTESYPLFEILYSGAKLKEVTDFTSGEKRNRRWGCVMSLGAVPQFDAVPVNAGPTLLPNTQPRFFAADSVQELRDRIMYEVDKALNLMRMAVEDPDEYNRIYRQQLAAVGQVDDDNDMN